MTNRNNQRWAFRLHYKKDEDAPKLVIDGNEFPILDLSHDALRFEISNNAFDPAGRIEINTCFHDFSGRYIRFINRDKVILFTKKIPDELKNQIEADLKKFRKFSNRFDNDKRRATRLYYPSNIDAKLHIQDRALKIMDISYSAVRVREDTNKAGLNVTGEVVFPDKRKYYTMGEIIRLNDGKAVYLFTNRGIPKEKIASEALKSFDEHFGNELF